MLMRGHCSVLLIKNLNNRAPQKHPPIGHAKTFHLLMAELLPSAKSPFHQTACEHF